MAGYVIHLAVAEAYIEKHPGSIKNYEEFIQGVIFPDSVSDKSITHYGEKSSKVNLKKFLDDKEIDNDYNKGYFLHLVTDYIFYNHFLQVFSKDIYNDYDVLNKKLQEKFNVKIPGSIKNQVFYKDGKTRILDLDSTIKFIEETANLSLNEVKAKVLSGDKNWLEFRSLKKI